MKGKKNILFAASGRTIFIVKLRDYYTHSVAMQNLSAIEADESWTNVHRGCEWGDSALRIFNCVCVFFPFPFSAFTLLVQWQEKYSNKKLSWCWQQARRV